MVSLGAGEAGGRGGRGGPEERRSLELNLCVL